jgi:3-methyladenine DNA glycosylase Tag
MPDERRAPERIEPRSLADYLEVMSKAVFQTGMSWKVVDSKWPGIREAFRAFDPAAVAALTPDDLDAITRDPRVIRNRRKIEATVDNAHHMLELERQHGTLSTSTAGGPASGGSSGQGFRAYLRSHDGFEATVSDLRKRFKFLGDTGCYYFLWVMSEDVPSYDDWCASRGRTPMH